MVLKDILENIEIPFYKKLLEKGEFVSTVNSSTLDLELPDVYIRAKECFRNATLLSVGHPDIKYCLGYSHHIIPFEHAWNSYKGQYFDLTNERIIQGDIEYLKVYEFTKEELWEHLKQNNNVPPDFYNMGFYS